jgi:hypothetical protein
MGIGWADVDGDGLEDLLVTHLTNETNTIWKQGPPGLFRNHAPDRGHWLMARVMDPLLKRDVPCARVVVEAGTCRWVRTAHSAGSYLCSSDPRVHFGLGTVAVVDAIEVRWPDGKAERFPGGPVDRLLTLARGQGRPVSAPAAGRND